MRNGDVLACRRKRTVRYPLKWEFPGGKIESGETAAEALVRELREELAIEAVPGRVLHRQSWVYPDHDVDSAFDVTYLLVRSFTGTPVNRTFEEIRWVPPAFLLTMDILDGNREAVERLARLSATPEIG